MKQIRELIREIILEQVVGYTPPSSNSSNSSDSSDDDDAFIQQGDLSTSAPSHPTETSDSEDLEQLQTQRQQINKQRQQDLDKGDAVAANYDARIAKKLQKSTG